MTGIQGYTRSAHVYDALNRTRDYQSASDAIVALVDRVVPGATTLLDVGCGTGRHIEHFRRRFRVEGLDLSPAMLEIAARRNPGVPLHEGSLVDFRIGRQFDVVTCLFGAIAYAGTRGLVRSMSSLARHLRPGGLLVIEPWVSRARFATNKLVLDTVVERRLKVARMYTTRRRGRTAILDVHYLIGDGDRVTEFVERHRLALFSDRDYRGALREAGLRPFRASLKLFDYGVYTGQKR